MDIADGWDQEAGLWNGGLGVERVLSQTAGGDENGSSEHFAVSKMKEEEDWSVISQESNENPQRILRESKENLRRIQAAGKGLTQKFDNQEVTL